MSDLPTVIVEDHPDWWLWDGAMPSAKTVLIVNGDSTWVHAVPYAEWPFTVHVDHDLPTVEWLDLSDPNTVSGGHRPLRAGDRVTLATECGWEECPSDPSYPIPFATATVAKIDMSTDHGYDLGGWLVTVNDIEALP